MWKQIERKHLIGYSVIKISWLAKVCRIYCISIEISDKKFTLTKRISHPLQIYLNTKTKKNHMHRSPSLHFKIRIICINFQRNNKKKFRYFFPYSSVDENLVLYIHHFRVRIIGRSGNMLIQLGRIFHSSQDCPIDSTLHSLSLISNAL